MNIQCTCNNYIPASGRAVSTKPGASLVDRSVLLTLSPSLLVLCPSLACKASWSHAYRHERRCKLASLRALFSCPPSDDQPAILSRFAMVAEVQGGVCRSCPPPPPPPRPNDNFSECPRNETALQTGGK